jgi:uncharacterized ferritin-like protein (DUF455 family)
MEIREYAERLVASPELEAKLEPPAGLTDERPGEPLRLAAPGRAPQIAVADPREVKVKVPPLMGMRDPSQRARILHALANHELQAIELFAWALLAFPETPAAFRRGLLVILAEEQTHFGLYRERLRAHGMEFGDQPITGHFWNQLDAMTTPLGFVCAMGLTFENANLDFAGDYRQAALDAGDDATAEALAVVHADEERHVRFAYRWLRRFAPEGLSPWQTYVDTVRFPLGPGRARGRRFDLESRRRAGLDDEFIAELERTPAVRPSGSRR